MSHGNKLLWTPKAAVDAKRRGLDETRRLLFVAYSIGRGFGPNSELAGTLVNALVYHHPELKIADSDVWLNLGVLCAGEEHQNVTAESAESWLLDVIERINETLEPQQ